MRFYKLAQDLKNEGYDVDARTLLALCNKLGISFQGTSALGSIPDDEVDRIYQHVKQYMKLFGEEQKQAPSDGGEKNLD